MDLPKDFQYIIIRKMDIDTRRSLRIYTKLVCPMWLEIDISKTFNKINNKRPNLSLVSLGSRSLMAYPGPLEMPCYLYKLRRCFQNNNMTHNTILYVPVHKKHIHEFMLDY